MRWIKRFLLLLVLGAIGGAAYWGLRPQPVPVDVAVIARGPLHVTVGGEGMARIRDVYRVSAPIAGRVARTTLRVGDAVAKGETVVARIFPADPPFVDARTSLELEAAVAAARAAVGHVQAELARTKAMLRMAEGDLDRAQRLAGSGTISARALEKAVLDVETGAAQVLEMEAQLELRASEQARAEARLLQPGSADLGGGEVCCIAVPAPVGGVVLALPVESEQVVAIGTVLAEIGSTSDLEIVVDLLSSDALPIPPGAAARVTEWGGAAPLAARVRRIDPAAFTKVSALGIEEQRVDVTLDFEADPSELAGLGHGYRVYVDIVTWHGDDVLLVPLGALFRDGADWATFVVAEGRASLRKVVLDHRSTKYAEVLDGLAPGDRVVLHPSDRIEHGVEVAER